MSPAIGQGKLSDEAPKIRSNLITFTIYSIMTVTLVVNLSLRHSLFRFQGIGKPVANPLNWDIIP